MKTIKPSLRMMFIAISLFSCNAQNSDNQKTGEVISGDIQVFYFHFTKRCVTCNAVENETKLTLKTFYSDKVKEGKIDFTSLNLEDNEGKEIAEALGVSGQTLLIVKGDTHLNLTNEGFMNARTNPEKFHEILKSNIDKLL